MLFINIKNTLYSNPKTQEDKQKVSDRLYDKDKIAEKRKQVFHKLKNNIQNIGTKMKNFVDNNPKTSSLVALPTGAFVTGLTWKKMSNKKNANPQEGYNSGYVENIIKNKKHKTRTVRDYDTDPINIKNSTILFLKAKQKTNRSINKIRFDWIKRTFTDLSTMEISGMDELRSNTIAVIGKQHKYKDIYKRNKNAKNLGIYSNTLDNASLVLIDYLSANADYIAGVLHDYAQNKLELSEQNKQYDRLSANLLYIFIKKFESFSEYHYKLWSAMWFASKDVVDVIMSNDIGCLEKQLKKYKTFMNFFQDEKLEKPFIKLSQCVNYDSQRDSFGSRDYGIVYNSNNNNHNLSLKSQILDKFTCASTINEKQTEKINEFIEERMEMLQHPKDANWIQNQENPQQNDHIVQIDKVTNNEIAEKDNKVIEKDNEIMETDGETVEKDNETMEEDGKIVEKDNETVEKHSQNQDSVDIVSVKGYLDNNDEQYYDSEQDEVPAVSAKLEHTFLTDKIENDKPVNVIEDKSENNQADNTNTLEIHMLDTEEHFDMDIATQLGIDNEMVESLLLQIENIHDEHINNDYKHDDKKRSNLLNNILSFILIKKILKPSEKDKFYPDFTVDQIENFKYGVEIGNNYYLLRNNKLMPINSYIYTLEKDKMPLQHQRNPKAFMEQYHKLDGTTRARSLLNKKIRAHYQQSWKDDNKGKFNNLVALMSIDQII